jgi:hypothetical protein
MTQYYRDSIAQNSVPPLLKSTSPKLQHLPANQCRHREKRPGATAGHKLFRHSFLSNFNKFSQQPPTAVLLCDRKSCSLAKRQPTVPMQARPAGGRNLINMDQRYRRTPGRRSKISATAFPSGKGIAIPPCRFTSSGGSLPDWASNRVEIRLASEVVSNDSHLPPRLLRISVSRRLSRSRGRSACRLSNANIGHSKIASHAPSKFIFSIQTGHLTPPSSAFPSAPPLRRDIVKVAGANTRLWLCSSRNCLKLRGGPKLALFVQKRMATLNQIERPM